MKKDDIYKDDLGEDTPSDYLIRMPEDFLPPPEVLMANDPNVKITISLSQSSINFFKKSAKKTGSKYQTMIRKVLDGYVAMQERINNK